MPTGSDGNLKIGSNDIDKVNFGTGDASAVYLGSNQVWIFGTIPVWSSISNQTINFNTNFSLDLNDFVSGTPTPTITVSGLPSGITASNGVISGNLTQRINRIITATATNVAGSTETTFRLTMPGNVASMPREGQSSIAVRVHTLRTDINDVVHYRNARNDVLVRVLGNDLRIITNSHGTSWRNARAIVNAINAFGDGFTAVVLVNNTHQVEVGTFDFN